ncbi:hypothetical protein FF38_00044 [Lucilia cuprina]|uniref:EMI domain-containing protein n=1 Tax=Lucilia cuprina TaxID=7375 RepID=A0A0L0BMB2_LUCCU|nr:hypothetical protein FF38_00044 [Lucilia cuprina]
MSIFKKYLKILIFLNLILLNLSKANDGLKINTDLTAGIISDNLNSASGNNNNQNLVDSSNAPLQNNSDSIGVMPATSASEDNHICTREEEYVEETRTPSLQPVKIRTATWCLEFPPRCSNYKTEMREVVKVQVGYHLPLENFL